MPYPYEETIRLIKGKLKEIENNVYKIIDTLDVVAWVTPEPVNFDRKTTGKKMVVAINQKWGELWDCAWFNFKGNIPISASGDKIVLLIDLSGEGCIYNQHGCPIQGLTNVSSTFDFSLGRPGKRVVEITSKALGNENIDLWVDAGCNDLFGSYKGNGELKEAYVAACNENLKTLYYDYTLLLELMGILPKESARTYSIGYALKEAALALNEFSESEITNARDILSKELEKNGGDPSLHISAIGHAHIDLAWLWPIRETKRKIARTFSTVLKMMEKYPDYVFGASQPQIYEWTKDEYPLLYNKIKEKVAEGRWEPQGGMWVEADTNMSGGEALIRQFLYGKRFFQTEFDKNMEVLWLPDVFGYTGSLPQIIRKCGCNYFMTIKLSWNSVNQFPHHTFVWEGIDGTDVLVHMPPEGTYNSSAAPRAILKSEYNFLEKGISDDCLILFGIGDGGGGPGEEHMEMLKREKNLEGLAPVRQEASIDFFHKLNKNEDKYAKWVGELYLEKHQGTYTSQAKSKYYNRKIEISLRDLEIILSMANLLGYNTYPKEKLDKIWKEILLYQFHDILPGSSIKRVYDESIARYSEIQEEISELTRNTINEIAGHTDKNSVSKLTMLVNTLSWERTQWIETNNGWILANVPPMGYSIIDSSRPTAIFDTNVLIAEDYLLENDLVRVKFNVRGEIISFFDKDCDREIMPQGTIGNQLAVYSDDGDAWDFSSLYNQKPVKNFKLLYSESFIEGPYCIIIQTYTLGESKITQRISLSLGNKMINFQTDIQWNESGKMLKALFPVNINTSEVVCDIQFGNIRRPTHTNTSWEMAKYEICAHKWVDLSQPDYGVALLNDCKYGHSVRGNIIELNLLRSSNYPGIDADRGSHKVAYALYPHAGNHIAGNVNRAGYELNIPLHNYVIDPQRRILISDMNFITVDKNNVIIEAIKRAEDSSDIIIRLYECNGMNSKAKISFANKIDSAQLVDMMEQHINDIEINCSKIELYFKPFEIHTIKLKVKVL